MATTPSACHPKYLGPNVLGGCIAKATSASPAAILDYYFRTLKASRPLHEAKLILVGFGEVGKTCLVNRLVHDRFDPSRAGDQGHPDHPVAADPPRR